MAASPYKISISFSSHLTNCTQCFNLELWAYAHNSKRKKIMGRPPLRRRVSYLPSITYFKPAEIPLRDLEEICLSVEELEAIRLKDMEDLEQKQCAEKMNVSRPTFVRILDSARKKVANALIQGKAIRIEGGNFEMAMRRFRCQNNHEWDVPYENLINNSPQACPICDTPTITPVQLLPQSRGHRRRSPRGQIQ
jgi:predicted DNA-binding protein (UPF0251 family)